MLNPLDLMLTLFTALCIAFCARFAHALTKDQQIKIDRVIAVQELNQEEVFKTIGWLDEIVKEDPKDEAAFGALAHLHFLTAVNLDNKDERIKRYQKSIDAADRAIALNPQSLLGNFWRSASLGKQGLDRGKLVFVSEGLHKEMKKSLDIAIGVNERYDHGAPQRALGRLYYELPGWPVAFGDKKLALEHLKKAFEIDPDHYGNKIYYAQALMRQKKYKEARPLIFGVLEAPEIPEHKKEMSEYISVAKDLKEELPQGPF